MQASLPSPPELFDTAGVVFGRVYVTARCPSVCLSVCLSRRSTAAAACDGFAAVGPAGRRYQSIAARPALSSNCEQCHVVS